MRWQINVWPGRRARACGQTTMLALCSCPTSDSRSLLVASFPGLHRSSALFVLQATIAAVEAWERGYLLVQQGGSTSEVWIEGARVSELEALARISVSSSIPKKMRHVDGPSRFLTFSGKPRRAQVFSSSERIVFAIVALMGSNCNNIIKKMLQVSSLAG